MGDGEVAAADKSRTADVGRRLYGVFPRGQFERVYMGRKMSTLSDKKARAMPRSKEQLLQTIVDTGVIAVIRAPSPEILVPIAEALLEGGVPAVEVTMS